MLYQHKLRLSTAPQSNQQSSITPSMTHEEILETPYAQIACTSGNVSVTERFALRHIMPDDNNPYAILSPLTRWDNNSTVIHASCNEVAARFSQALGTPQCKPSKSGKTTKCELRFARVSHTQNGRGHDREPATVTVSAQNNGGNYTLNHLAGVAWV
ncbi:hypothetical protein [Shewanella waksmanii]|uniref:hypothetical protein n=1 Tax=Shewanella waksmanii TaxID=213783 RepID=UPI00048D3DF8|nr:hypothetical protein [Shewanella waksmanii]